jgi:type IV pilus assembly protein PilF
VRLPLALVACLAAAACSGGGANSPAGRDPVRMSESEYDVARDLWLRQGKTREALAHALEAIELDDENADAAHLAALLYLDFCRLDISECRLKEAERFARRALKLKADYREARNTLGVVLIHQKRYAEAVSVLKPLTADILYQTPENAWGNLGWAYLEQGQIDPAIDALRRSVAAQPQFCVGNYRLGQAHERKAQLVEAKDAYTRALETADPRCKGLQDAFAGRARVMAKLGQADAARSDLERCVGLDRRTPAGKECGAMLRKLK